MHRKTILIPILTLLWSGDLSPAELMGVRLGEHLDKTRLVLDLKGESPFNRKSYILYNTHASQKYLGTHQGKGRITSYTLERTGKHLKISFQLSPSMHVLQIFSLPSPSRLVIDVGPFKKNQKTLAKKEVPVAQTRQPKTSRAVSDIPQRPLSSSVLPETAVLQKPGKIVLLTKPALKTIIIDPGHGGKDPGTTVGAKVREKDIVLQIAKSIQNKIYEAGLPYNVRLTRNHDIYIPLRKRYEIARQEKADLFLSLHADSHQDQKMRGLSIYTLSETASDKEAELLAKKENKADLVAGIDLAYISAEVTNILISLTQRETQHQSEQFARLFTTSIPRHMHASSHPHRFAGFAVLKAPDIPSVLIELGYLSNPQDRRLLQEKDYQKMLASRIVHAIDRYFKTEIL